MACFIYYGSVSFIGFLYMIFFLKDTTYAESGVNKVSDSQIYMQRLMSEKEKKELYMPDEFKENSIQVEVNPPEIFAEL